MARATPMHVELSELLIAAVLAALLAGVIGGMLRGRAAMAWFLAPALLLLTAVEFDSQWRNVSYHGLMHSSIVYGILERGAPPENPLLAGETMRYPYAHHYLIAGAMRALPFAPTLFFAATNFACLALFLWLIDRIARRFSKERAPRVFAGLLALTGTNPFCIGIARAWLGDLAYLPDRRIVPFTKFTTINSNQIGLVFFALAMLGLIDSLRAGGSRRRAFVCLAIGIGGAGFLYPYLAVSAGLCAGVMAVGTAATGEIPRRTAAGILGAAAVGSLIAAPFLLSVLGAGGSAGDGGATSSFQLAPTRADLLRNAWDLGLVLVLPALLFGIRRDVLRVLWREHRLPLATLLVAAAINASLYLVLYITEWRAQYKFAALAMVLLAIPLAAVLADIHRRRGALALALAFLFLMPVAHWCTSILRPGWTVTDEVTTRGRYLEHEDPAQRALHVWIGENTPINAVLLDTTLMAPALARRPLLVGPNVRQERNGWGNGPSMLYDTQPDVLARRRELARCVLGDSASDRTTANLAALAQESGSRPLFIVARRRTHRTWLTSEPQAEAVFANRAAGVFAISTR